MATHSQVASSSKGVRNSLASRNPGHEKDLEKFFKILFKGFWWLSLATHSRVNWVAKIACFAQIGLKLQQFFKNFSVSLTSHAFFFDFSASPSLKNAIFTPKPLFLSSIFTQNPWKGMGFHFLSLYFKFIALFFMELLLVLKYWNMVDEHGFLLFVMKLLYGFCWDGIMLILHVYTTCSCIILCFVLCCAYHIVDKMFI